jgi:5'-nucleotidase
LLSVKEEKYKHKEVFLKTQMIRQKKWLKEKTVFLSVFVIVLVCFCFSTSATSTYAESKSLNILLTNDDGWNALGIQAMKVALIQDGHNVTLVAPSTNFSGAGTSLANGPLVVTQQSPNEYSVEEGPPGTCVLIGLAILGDNPPDLLVSGANIGFGSGPLAIHSGTIGAAQTGLVNGIPAIACGSDLINKDDPTDPVNVFHFQDVARFVADVISELQESKHAIENLLPPGVGLLVNYPRIPPGSDPVGIKVLPLTHVSPFTFKYAEIAPGLYRLLPIPNDPSTFEGDLKALLEGNATIVPFDADLNTSNSNQHAVKKALKEFIKE